MWLNPQFPADLVTFTEEIFHRKLHSFCELQLHSAISKTTKNTLMKKLEKSSILQLLSDLTETLGFSKKTVFFFCQKY